MTDPAANRPTKRERTRLALLQGAVDVIAEKGIAGTRITDVTDHVSVSNGTFYNYFADKNALIQAVALEVARNFAGAIDADMADEHDAVRRVVRATATAIDAAVADPAASAVLIELLENLPDMRAPVLDFLRQDLELGITQGTFALEVTPFVLEQVLALVVSAVRWQLHAGADRACTRQACAHVLRLCGLTPAAARRATASA